MVGVLAVVVVWVLVCRGQESGLGLGIMGKVRTKGQNVRLTMTLRYHQH